MLVVACSLKTFLSSVTGLPSVEQVFSLMDVISVKGEGVCVDQCTSSSRCYFCYKFFGCDILGTFCFYDLCIVVHLFSSAK